MVQAYGLGVVIEDQRQGRRDDRDGIALLTLNRPAAFNSLSRELLGSLEQDSTAGITVPRLWTVMKRFFVQVADVIQEQSPATAEKLRRASPHCMRQTHATHALERGVDLTTVRDNLRHASLSTTSIYLHTDEEKRARQLGAAFSGQSR